MTKPFEIPEAIFYLRPHFLLRSLPSPPECLLLWKVILSKHRSETPPARAAWADGCCVVTSDADAKIKYSNSHQLRSLHHLDQRGGPRASS